MRVRDYVLGSAAAVLMTGCAGDGRLDFSGERDLDYAVGEIFSAPISFFAGAAKEFLEDPIAGAYHLTGRAATEAGRIANGATHLATGHRYEAKFGEVHPLVRNNPCINAAVLGVAFAPILPLTFLESAAIGGAGCLSIDYLTEKDESLLNN
tara:strand:- start:873 stop:1328 length:456 start_codon:yes stop_codon:yes gene_type:complete